MSKHREAIAESLTALSDMSRAVRVKISVYAADNKTGKRDADLLDNLANKMIDAEMMATRFIAHG